MGPTADGTARTPRLVLRGDTVRFEDGHEAVVRNVRVILGLADGTERVLDADNEVAFVLPRPDLAAIGEQLNELQQEAQQDG